MRNLDRKGISIHEAGHAVAHVRFGILQSHLSVVPDDFNLGKVLSEGLDHVHSNDEARQMALAYCAGYAALIAAGYPSEDAHLSTWHDFEQVEELIERWDLQNLEQLKEEAVALMSEERNIAAVELIADYAFKNDVVPADYLDVLVDLSDGECTQAEFEQFLAFRRKASE